MVGSIQNRHLLPTPIDSFSLFPFFFLIFFPLCSRSLSHTLSLSFTPTLCILRLMYARISLRIYVLLFASSISKLKLALLWLSSAFSLFTLLLRPAFKTKKKTKRKFLHFYFHSFVFMRYALFFIYFLFYISFLLLLLLLLFSFTIDDIKCSLEWKTRTIFNPISF